MRKSIQYLICVGLTFGCFLLGCKRQELAEQPLNKIISLNIIGTTLPADTLEFLKNGKVIAEAAGTGSGTFDMLTKVTMEGGAAEIQVRRKSDQKLIATKKITAELFDQVLRFYYDGQQVYDTSVDLEIKGYSGDHELEFMLDGVLIGSGMGAEFPSLTVILNKEKKRQVQIRKKGDPNVLLHYEVIGDMPVQKLVFYYDGVQLLDKIELGSPVNPANMLLSVSFKSAVDVFTGPVDLVFCKGSIYEDPPFYPATDIRIELNSDGSFSKNVEIPALTPKDLEEKLQYGIKLVKRGTLDELPYDLTNQLKPINRKSGYATNPIVVSAGAAMLLVINDSKTVKTTGLPSNRGTYFSVNATDISAYFKP